MATTFTQEFHTSIAPEKAFRSFIVDAENTMTKALPNVVKSIQREAGGILKVALVNGGQLKVKLDALDAQNKICKFTLIEGEILGKKLESVTFEEKYEPASDGGSIVKVKGEFHPKAGFSCSEADKAQAMSMFKAAEAFFLANPTICA